METGAGQAQRGGLARGRAVGLRRRGQRAQQVRQRRLAGTEGLVDQRGTFAQQAGARGLGFELRFGRAQGIARGRDVTVQALAQPLLVGLCHVQLAERSGFQRPVAVVGTEGQAQPDGQAALCRFGPAPDVLSQAHAQLGRVAP